MDLIFLTSLSTFLLIAATYWFMPYVTPKTIVFGVRIPPGREDDPGIASIRKRYHSFLLAGSLAVFLLLIALPGIYSSNFIGLSSTYVEIIFAFLVYYSSFRKLEAVKNRDGWYTNLRESSGAIVGEELPSYGRIGPILSILPAVAIVAATLYIGITVYPTIPGTIATHYGAGGRPNGFSTKSVDSVFLQLFIQIGITAMMYGIGYGITRTRQEIDVTRAIASQIQQEKFKHYSRESLSLFAALIDFTLMSSSLVTWGLLDPQYILVYTLVPLLSGSAVLSFVLMSMGQMGSRLSVPPEVSSQPVDTTMVNRNDDRFWIMGTIYYNRDDPSIFVGKRFGVGWSLNFANPKSWIILVSIVASALLIPILTLLAIR